MSELLGDFISSPPAHLVFLIPVFAFLEACALVGLFVSGVFLLSTSTLLYAQDSVGLGTIVALAFAGALVGDHTGYYLGSKLGPRFWELKWFTNNRSRIQQVNQLLAKSAPWTICIGRLSPPLRSVTPIVAGISGIKPRSFLLYDLLACSIWSLGLLVLVSAISSQV